MQGTAGEEGGAGGEKLAGVDVYDQGGFVEPTAGGGVAPKGGAARVAESPPDGDEVGVGDEVVGGVELDAVEVGIAEVEKEGVAEAVAAGAALQAMY
jgi:hypothetical protein